MEQRNLLDPRRITELLQRLVAGVLFFFVTIIDHSAAQQWIDARKKKGLGPGGGAQPHCWHHCCMAL